MPEAGISHVHNEQLVDGFGQDKLARLAVVFVRILKRAGVAVPGGASIDYARALSSVGLSNRAWVYWAGRTTLLRRQEDIATYDHVFDAFWSGGQLIVSPMVEVEVPVSLVDGEDDQVVPDTDEVSSSIDTKEMVVYSPAEVLREKDFRQCSQKELEEAYKLMERISVGGAVRKSRRMVPSKHDRRHPDLRRSTSLAMRMAGEPLRQAWLSHSLTTRRVVLLCDVSGSMEPYHRALLRFLHVAVSARSKVEAFALGTRLTRVTRELLCHDPDAALRRAASAILDRSGGTRLGEGLKSFNDSFGVRGIARGAVVVIMSDGWDRGDPAQLAREMARLKRVAYKIIWVNPLKATPGYAPLARGMAAALPYTDAFLEGHSVASLENLARVIQSLS